MSIQKILLGIIFVISSIGISCSIKTEKQKDNKNPYWGQTPPQLEAELFAPGIISTAAHDMSISISKDLKNIYVGRSSINWISSIVYFFNGENGWESPQIASFTLGLGENYPFLSPDNKQIYFNSSRPNSENKNERASRKIWFSELLDDKWSTEKLLISDVENKAHMAFPSISNKGTIYFNSNLEDGYGNSDIYCIRKTKDTYGKAENLGLSINSENHEFHPYISPNEDYLIFDAMRPEGFGGNDLYISFKTSEGKWTKAINMGEKVNSQFSDMRPYVSPDNKYLFFCSNRENRTINYETGKYNFSEFSNIVNGPGNGSQDMYWIDAKIIEDLKLKALKDRD